MNQFQALVADLEADYPAWQVWYVPHAVGPAVVWHARRWDGTSPRLGATRAVDLADAIEEAEGKRD